MYIVATGMIVLVPLRLGAVVVHGAHGRQLQAVVSQRHPVSHRRRRARRTTGFATATLRHVVTAGVIHVLPDPVHRLLNIVNVILFIAEIHLKDFVVKVIRRQQMAAMMDGVM